ncbi:Dps family protein [Flavobacterium sp. NKUCC04_CG]|uniref:Dps family protein n=1 Tax=Flavobacterium sp. NKUCC04_CG TaxID=2842121 RepID=UPI001C5AC520|nr:DNA starvation/stationary phase protection protein [Flavobacterium sp. NKUCC04_CG]MBW3520122.1 DNA starvation/stationary phase protection protein [Flavobacterium sp. NKUCC04_CG]
MKTLIGIKAGSREKTAEFLSAILADEFILYTKTRNAHWNVEGADFHAMHLFFESQYTELETVIDEVAERIRQIGHYAPATLKEYLALTHLTEARRGGNDSMSFIKDLLNDHDTIIKHIRENINTIEEELDYGTSDFVTGIMMLHEKQAWMLRAHIK